MPSLAWSTDLDNNLAPMDDTHREFVECYNAAANAAPEDFLAALDALADVGHHREHAIMLGAVAAGEVHRLHPAVFEIEVALRVLDERVERGDHFLGRRLMEELPAWFVNHVNGMDAALAFHLATIGFDVDSCTLRPLAEGETRAAGCGCATLAAEDAAVANAAARVA